MRKEFEVELSRKEEEHGDEVNQLKVDMLVALQVARSGNASPVHAHQDEPAVTETISQAREQLTLEVRPTDINPSTPKSDQFQIPPAASPGIHTSHSMEKFGFHTLLTSMIIMLPILTTSPIHFSLKGW